MKIRLRHTNSADLNAFFIELQRIWLKSKRQIPEQQIYFNWTLLTIQPNDNFKIRLAKNLDYTEIGTDNDTLKKFIYEDLKKKLGGGQIAYVRKSPFTFKNAYTTKKGIRKVVQKAKQTRNCLICGKSDNNKVNCSRLKCVKKVNYVYQDEEEDSENSEEYILEEKDPEEEIEEDDEYINDDINDKHMRRSLKLA
ncbi:hypothetical protein RclHR1_01040037 [Rhizophagus clarus]|uniref:Uncharacterized protein n=1 Tax=Rhizophagus clarus TaxID=94130 RepID=A0A2Z6Q627_9GLOM|nr:hypothetical protein RclHR1_01040037 [Rhizophagus clarus]GET02679.1 hypothetical protein GLOIN_2v1772633 [Rhizophagus clarus]